MRSRNRLHVDKLRDFTKFCESLGWTAEEPKGWEVLRMFDAQGDFMSVYGRAGTAAGAPLVHLTTWGESERLLNLYFAEKNSP